MSIVIAIRRSGRPFEAAELERVAAARGDLTFASDHLTWIRPNTADPITLNITSDEIWTDDPRSTTVGELTFLKDLAKELRAEVYCEGEPMTDPAVTPTPAKTTLGVLVVVVTAPVLLAWAIIRLPWVIWQIKRRSK